MDIEAMDELGQDAAAVAAVRNGDAERYRELVERHEHRVFAVAWSRLGDAELAEEATQEAFIKGYHRLWLLADGAKFAGWIASIARNAAINLGMRHRRELQKRERWALEQPASSAATEHEAEDVCSPEILRETLLSLPAAHRECLVLFYLEGKSGEEAAFALSVSESAFRVRLHRAKAVLREQLEEKLAGSLEKLRPSKSLVPVIMATVLASSSAQAATTGGTIGVGFGTKLITTLGKSTLFAWLLPFIGLVGVLPGMLFTWWWSRLERQNYREQDGFRPRMHERLFRSFFWGFPLVMVSIWMLVNAGGAAWGVLTVMGVFTCLMLPQLFFSFRLLAINRSNYFILNLVCFTLIFLLLVSVSLGFLPPTFLCLFTGAYTFAILGRKDRPNRIDYNLFLRAVQKMLPSTSIPVPRAIPPLSRNELSAFARFMGEQWLVCDFRWESQGLVLYLPPVSSSFLKNIRHSFLPLHRNGSSLCLHWDGSVNARCGEKDFITLHSMEVGQCCSIADLEEQVGIAVEQAWREYRQGHAAASQRLLGEVSDDSVFLVPPARSKAVRWQRFALGLTLIPLAALLLVMMVRPQWLSDLKPVEVSEAQVRAALVRFGQPGEKRPVTDVATHSLMNCFVLPAQADFDETIFFALRNQLLKSSQFDPNGTSEANVNHLEHDWLLKRAVVVGWLTLSDLKVTSAAMKSYLSDPKQPAHKFMLSQRNVRTDAGDHTVEQLDSQQLAQLRVWQQLDCLSFLDREKLIRQVASWQVSNGQAYGDRPPLPDWRQARGLFATSGWPAIQDTYFAIAGLEILGGLDKIDREACIQGILRLHHGEGFFAATRVNERWKIQVRGDAKDTFCAFEILRMLGALDRVKDLEKWQFRVKSNRKTEQVTGDEIEAWVCQQRLARVVKERKINPQAPVRSLLEP